MKHSVTETQRLKFILVILSLMLLLSGCQTKMAARQAQSDLKTLVETSTPIFEHDHVALLHCGNFADHEKIKTCITQTKRAVDIWFGDKPKSYISRLLIFSPDEPLGKRLASEMQSTTHVAGNTEARTHTILIAGYPSQESFWTTLRHELTHDAMLRHYDNPDLLPPFWITEGMATAFEVPAFADGKPDLNPMRLAKAKRLSNQLTPAYLAPLIDRSSNTRSSSSDYAIAWTMTYYLMRQQSTLLRRYLMDYQQNASDVSRSHLQRFEHHFCVDTDLKHLADQCQRWIKIQSETRPGD